MWCLAESVKTESRGRVIASADCHVVVLLLTFAMTVRFSSPDNDVYGNYGYSKFRRVNILDGRGHSISTNPGKPSESQIGTGSAPSISATNVEITVP